jgi:RNA polymerase sigma-70 factor (ECF subfamily)
VNSPATREKDLQFRSEALPHFDAVARFALALTRDETEADDLGQDTFLQAYRSWHLYALETECRGWLFTICRNLFLRRRQRDERQVACEDAELEALGAAAVHAAAHQSGFDDVIDRIDVLPAIHEALAKLPHAFREAVVLVDLEDLSYEEAARIIGVPTGTVRSRLFRGRRLIQESLMAFAHDMGLAHQRAPTEEKQ